MLDLTRGYELLYHVLYGVARDGETYALEAAGVGDDLGVHPDHRPTRVQQRPPGVAGVDRRVRLQSAAYSVVVGGFYRASDAADYTGRHAYPNVERVADGDDRLADIHRVRVA